MARVTTGQKDISKRERVVQLYAPSWVDRFTARVARLPGPSWSYYFGLGLVLFLIQAVVLWVEGAFPAGSVDSAHVFLAAAIPYQLALIHYFDRRAGEALADMRPVLKSDEQEQEQMLHRLTTLPARPTLLAGIAALGCAVLLGTLTGHYQLEALDTFPISANLLFFIYLVLWWLFGTLVYHTFHQLGLINHIYSERTCIGLFRKKGLYAFSNLAALTAGSIAMLPMGFMFANPAADMADPAVLGTVLGVQFIAVVTFVWPQLGIHRLQVAEKERLLDEVNQRFQATFADLHQRLDSGNLEGITDVNTAIATLEMERNSLERIPTWPWEPEVVRLLISALALPLGLWVIQYILQQVLGS